MCTVIFGIFLRLLDIVGVVFVVPDDIGLARLQAGEARLRVRQRLQHDAVEMGMALVPVVRILLQHHAVARVPGLQYIGSGADRIAIVVVALGLPGRRRMNDVIGTLDRQQRRQVHRRIVEIVNVCQFIGRLHVVNERDVKRAAALVGGILLPVEVFLDGLGVERRAVVEFDAGPQFESPGLVIVRMGPGERELRHRLALVVESRPAYRKSQRQRFPPRCRTRRPSADRSRGCRVQDRR